VAIIDPKAEWTVKASALRSKCDFSPYEDMTLQGRVFATISRGETIFLNGELKGLPGRGRFLPR